MIQRTLNLLNSSDVKDQDIYMPMGGLLAHPGGIEALWAYVKENWDDIYKRFPPSGMMLGSIVSIATQTFTKPEQLADVESFFADKDKTGYQRTLEQSKDTIRSRISWVERDSEDLKFMTALLMKTDQPPAYGDGHGFQERYMKEG